MTESKQYTYQELLDSELKPDVLSVSQWLNTTNLVFKLVLMDINVFEKQITEMYESYPVNPEDAERTEVILDLIKDNNPIYPIFIEANDPDKFILEGRHRSVAQWKLKQPIIYVLEAIKI